ncbi:MAG: CBS domain-containing protein [Phycisphaerales bacterium]|nr:MAG: CBS domain-containing protein [Phycisphaerales bacterium]
MSSESGDQGRRSAKPAAPPAVMSEHLMRLAERVTIGMVMTPLCDLVCADPQTTVGQARELMGASYDQLPLMDGPSVEGLILRESLEGKDAGAPARSALTPLCDLVTVRADEVIPPVVQLLVDDRCVLVFDANDDRFCGLVHFSDLNKHAVRTNVYLWISALEMGLAELIHRRCPDFRQWLGILEERRQITILGRYEYERQRHIELDPLEGAELSDLLKIVRSIPVLLEPLGLTKSQLDRKTGHLVKMRHAAMHPVRSLIRSHEDLTKWLKVFADLIDVLDHVYAALDKKPRARSNHLS